MVGDIEKVIKPGKIGSAEISWVQVSKLQAAMSNFSGGVGACDEGKFLRLTINGCVVMSNTPMERRSNSEVIWRSHGDVLIGGLGMAMILVPILAKSEVNSVTVIERNPDVIKLVQPQLKSKKLTVIESDVNEWKPAKGQKFNVIYFDIWNDICIDNLKEIAKLHNKFKYHLDRTDEECWMNSWMAEYLRSQKRAEDRNYW